MCLLHVVITEGHCRVAWVDIYVKWIMIWLERERVDRLVLAKFMTKIMSKTHLSLGHWQPMSKLANADSAVDRADDFS